MKRKGFTLIELLVVIAIIALLLSILMPSLGKVKEQARLVIDMANCKQISTLLVVHKTENDDYVPILLNQSSRVPAKSRYLSLALGDYQNLPASLDPQGYWTNDNFEEYCKTKLQKYYACPFVRNRKNKSAIRTESAPVTLDGPGGSVTYKTFISEGYRESYSAPLWWLNKDWVYTKGHPYGLPHGSAQYGSYRWFDASSLRKGWTRNNTTEDYNNLKRLRWSSNLSKYTGVSSQSENIVLSCNAGQYDGWSTAATNGGIVNYGSHKKGKYGGTTAVFADGSVQWVQGTRIGWP